MSAPRKSRVSYFYDSKRVCPSVSTHTSQASTAHHSLATLRFRAWNAGEFSTYYFGANHPMKPHRLTMTNHLVLGYELHKHMDMFVSVPVLGYGALRQLREAAALCSAHSRRVECECLCFVIACAAKANRQLQLHSRVGCGGVGWSEVRQQQAAGSSP